MGKLGKITKGSNKISLNDINTLTVYAFELENYILKLPVIFENRRKELEKELKEVNELIKNTTLNEDNISD